ncbi:stem-loop binding protein 2 isoform X2 [Anguilla rostrata]|uniref:stem-loop binding protein 2 isoform X2 n=1 Tax=Anguilla rostrata TaxID=7938 RepID=UPI0030CC9F97
MATRVDTALHSPSEARGWSVPLWPGHCEPPLGPLTPPGHHSYGLEPWLLPGCSSVYDRLVSNSGTAPPPPPDLSRDVDAGDVTQKPRRSSILERCILRISTASVAVGTEDDLCPHPQDMDGLGRAQSEGHQGPRSLDPSRCETNEAVLKRRQKQIQYGKNTCGYLNYLQQAVASPRAPPSHPEQVPAVQPALLGPAGPAVEEGPARLGPPLRQPPRCLWAFADQCGFTRPGGPATGAAGEDEHDAELQRGSGGEPGGSDGPTASPNSPTCPGGCSWPP